MPEQPDPVADILRTVQTSDRLRAAAWDAAYSSDDPDTVAGRLRGLPIGDHARARLFEVRFASAPEADTNVDTPPPTPSAARVQGDEQPAQFLNQMIRNAPRDAWEQGTGLVRGTGQLLADLGGATAETGAGIGNFLRESVGLTPHPQGTAHLQRLAGMPRAILDHYSQYLDPNARAERVREHPVGTALDLVPVGAALKAGVPAAASATRRGVSAVARAPGHMATRAIDAAIGAVKGNPWAMARGAVGHGPVETARGALAKMRGASEATPAAAAPASPAASSPATPASPAASIAARSSPAPSAASAPRPRAGDAGPAGPSPTYGQHPLAAPPSGGGRAQAPRQTDTVNLAPSQRTSGQMSEQWIANDVGMAARRLKQTLTPEQYAQAEQLVRAEGLSPMAAVAKAGGSAPAPPAATRPTSRRVARTEPPRGVQVDELQEYVRLRESGKTHRAAVKVLEQQRAFAQAHGTPTPAAARTRVAERNATGRWPKDE